MNDVVVTLHRPPVPMTQATNIQIALVRPDESVVERTARALTDHQLALDLHPEDLTLDGEYVGQVSCHVRGARTICAPAFHIEVVPEGAA